MRCPARLSSRGTGAAMRRFRTVTILLTSLALVTSVSSVHAVQAVADSPDPGIATLVKMLNDPTTSLQKWSSGLGGVGKMAEALPAVQASPGGVLGFDDLLTNAFSSGANHL